MTSEADVLSGPPAPEVLDDRIWVDGCWDFFHHGHAGAMLQARQLGDDLYVGVHSDESILENKGPTVMTLKERYERLFPALGERSKVLIPAL
jgi:ethanolamine-phosphate cytidylyltransferase